MVGNDSKGKSKVSDEKKRVPVDGNLKDDAPIDSGSNKKKDERNKKRIKKIIYHDSDTSSSSPKNNDDSFSKEKTVKQNYTRTSFNYSCISYNSNVHLLSIPLSKPPHFDGEAYSWWSHKMCSHLFSFHPSICDAVENRMHALDSDDDHQNGAHRE
jgi:hypothetical protein